MKDYYETLELTALASNEDIKRAYFKSVRKYPPDRFEVEFMNIRKAYEILSNEKTRKQYDSINNLDSDVKENYSLARTYMEEEEELNKAIKILQKMQKEDSKSLIVKVLLAEVYLKNSNSGKALTVYEELTLEEPENSAFAGYLANAYLNRGWHKKAILAYNKAIELDSDNISLWLGLSEAYVESNEYFNARNVLEKALEVVTDIKDNTTIYLELITIDMNFEMFSSIHKPIDKLAELAINNDEIKENITSTLSELASYLMQMEKMEDAKKIIEKAAKILPEDKDVLRIKNEIENYMIYIDDFNKLKENKKVNHEVVSLISFNVLPNNELGMHDEEEKEAMNYFQEYTVLYNYDIYKSSIKKLEKDYPHLYALKVEFFNKLTNNIERKKMQVEYKKHLGNYKHIINRFFDEDDNEENEESLKDYEPQEPIVREESKVGRNDLCPCGSGKKYKKCCGK
ncbi:tetratricopeptide repeat protein [Clostridium estertheticum]|uniref:Tetratricopeptide repeat protein n=1 Tax=Clostridium estertheticum TaxID=238834 RepID=A0A5N7ILV3_9CLOT|nr:tetratricopeptide repeat protein [Clostridium estertheticum]MPQ31284.1 tetratricopeptide repeat protein [Clostridium estertheticum]MPQ61958.1 tetratricopeptide repeat protein [Clostridium estertheticum]